MTSAIPDSNATLVGAESHPPPSYLQFLTSPIFEVIITVPDDDNTSASVTDQPQHNPHSKTTASDDSDSEPEASMTPKKQLASAGTTSLFGDLPSSSSLSSLSSSSSSHKPPKIPPTPNTVSFTVHKALLESVSKEMRKHIRNSMKEGLTNKMHLSDVLPDTFARFVQWAYTEDYPYSDRTTLGSREDPEKPASILVHTCLFVFAERFNITVLRTLARTRIEALLVRLVDIPGWHDMEAIDNLSRGFAVLLQNLPTTFLERPLPNHNTDPEPAFASNEENRNIVDKGGEVEGLLGTVLQFCARQANKLRLDAGYRGMMVGFPEFAVAIGDVLALMPTAEGGEQMLKGMQWGCGKCFQRLEVPDPRVRVHCSTCEVAMGPTLAV